MYMENPIEKAQASIIQVMIANSVSAVKISKILCDHSSDNILKADEIICGLIYRLMTPMTDDEIVESMTEAEDIMYRDSSDEDILETVDDIEELSRQRKVRTNTCNCDICSQVRVCLCNFSDYIPKDELGDKFKKSIIDTCETYDRII